MPSIGRQSHPSHRGPRPPTRRRSGVVAIAGTTVISVLAVVVVVLSYRVADRTTGVSPKDVSGLEARVDELSGRLDAMQTTVQTSARRAKASLAAAKRASRSGQSSAQPQLAACLTQVQREIDDLQAYLAYRTPRVATG